MIQKFDIQGMTCSSCSSHVEKAVSKLAGINKVNVNLLSNNMTVEFDENLLKSQDIIQAVTEAGYSASLNNSKEQKISNKDTSINDNISSMKKRLIISICFLIPLMYISMHEMLHHMINLPIPNFIKNTFDGTQNAIIFAFTQFLILLPILYINRNYFSVGIKRLIKRTPNMDSLIAIGSGAATLYGIFVIFMLGYGFGHNQYEIIERYSKDIYFESAGTILTLITLGKYLEARSKGKTKDAFNKLINLAPKTSIVLRENKEYEIKVEDIIVGDIIAIKPGSSIPVDGIVVDGNSSIDQSSITGESIPVHKTVGDTVLSGTTNKSGYLKMKATKIGEDSTLSQIIKLVEEASNSKAPISKIADKVSSIFVPTVILIALISTIVWLLIGKPFEFALTMGIAVLVISCPCALGLATPVAIMVGTGKGAENGILIKSAESLELLHSINTVVLDKTGTITEGKPKVTDIITELKENDFLQIAGSLEQNSEHPLADAIIERTNELKISLLPVTNFNSIPGRGIKGNINNITYLSGNLEFMKENKITISAKAEHLANQGKTLLYFAKGTQLIGIIAVSDTIKSESKTAIEELKKEHINVIMLTGDNKLAATAIGNSLNIDTVIAEVLPQDKQKAVEKLQKAGQKVAFVGDGINDSPALVQADVGIAIGSGTDIAIESADVVLIKNNLLDVVTAINLSKKVIKNIKINLFWAFFYNIIGIPVAAGVFYNQFGLKLNPMLGALAMSLSSVCVVTNALRLRKFKSNFKEEENKMEEFKKVINIEGMQCNHCKMTVEKVLGAIDGVEQVGVDLEAKTATITGSKNIDNAVIEQVITDEGFVVKGIE